MASLIALTDIKPTLNVRDTNTSQDAKLNAIIGAASKLIEAECRQTFTSAVRTEYHTSRRNNDVLYDFNGGSMTGLRNSIADQFIVLRASPINVSQPVSLWYDPCRQYDDTTLVDPSYYFLDPEPTNGRMIVHYCTDQVPYGFKVSYTAGFAIGNDDTLSADLQANAPDLFLAAQATAIHLWNRTNPDLVGSNQSDESNKSRWATVNSFGIPKEAQDLLKPYRRVLTGRL